MNSLIGKISCLLLMLSLSLGIKSQVSLEENNPTQYVALELGYDSIGKNIKSQIRKQVAIAALQGAIYREQRRVRKWKGHGSREEPLYTSFAHFR